MDWVTLLHPGNLGVLIPILGVLGWIVSMVLKHRERMALIEHGIHPDVARDPGLGRDQLAGPDSRIPVRQVKPQ